MTDTLELDWETYSDIDLMKLGLDLYSAHPSTEILMGAYALNGGDRARRAAPVVHSRDHLHEVGRGEIDLDEVRHRVVEEALTVRCEDALPALDREPEEVLVVDSGSEQAPAA